MSSSRSRKSVDPLAAFLIILGYAGLGWAWWDAAERAGQVPAPSHVQVTASDTLAVRVGERIEEMDADGGHLRTLELDQLGFAGSFGDFVMPEPDVLVAWADAGAPVASEGAGLYQCTLPGGPCERFAPELNHDHGVFRMHWSEEQGLAVVTLVSNELWLLDREGEVAARSAAVLDNANGVHGDGEHLWVADADHHRFVAFTRNGGRLEPTTELSGTLALWRRWPSGIVPAGDGYWALVAGPLMRFPGLALLDEHGGVRHQVPVPWGAEPAVMVPFGGGLLLGDMNGRGLYRVSEEGHWLGHAELAITPMLQEYRQRYDSAAWQRTLFQWLFIGSALIILLVLWWQERQQRRETYGSPLAAAAATTGAVDADRATVEPALDQQEEYWLEPPATLKRYRWIAHGSMLSVSAALVVLGFQEEGPGFLMLALAMILIMLSASLWVEQISRLRFGVSGRAILVRDWKGRIHRAADDEIAMTDSREYLRVGEVLVPLFNASGARAQIPTPVIREDREAWLEPRLEKATKLGVREAFALMWHQWPGVRSGAAGFGLLLAVFFLDEFGSGLL